MNAEDPAADRRFATTLARGLSVLRAFRPEDDGLGNAEIAARTGLPRSTVSRLTFTLRALGYLGHARGGDERYRPGPALLALGNVAARAITFVDVAAAPMQALADRTATLAVLAVRDGGKLLLARTWRPRGVASLWLEAGHRVPIARSSSGHALLAALDERGLAHLLGSGGTGEEGRSAPADEEGDDALDAGRAAAIRESARGQLRASGFVVADPARYFTTEIHAASVPFRTRELGEPVVFTCGATPADLPLERLRDEVGPALRAAVDELARLTGQVAANRFDEPEESVP